MRIGIIDSIARNPWIQGFALFLGVLLVYLPALSAPFIWDDNFTVTDNPFVRNPHGLRFIWFSTQATDYYPLTWSSLWLEWRLWKLDPAGYHATNILLHCSSALILWRILRRLEVPGAWAIALLFGIHPLAVDSVVWISQRKNTLSLFFACLSTLTFLRYRSSRDRKPRRLFYTLCLLAFAAALLSKTSLVGLPVLFLIIIWMQTGSLARRDFLVLLPHFLLAALASLVTLWFQGKVIGLGLSPESGPVTAVLAELSASGRGLLHFPGQLLLAGQTFAFYLLKTLLPLNLCMVYERWEIDPAALPSWLPFLLLLTLAIALYAARKKLGRAPLAALAIPFILLLPVLGFFTMAYHAYAWVANHLAYPGIPSLLTLLALLFLAILKKTPLPPPARTLVPALLTLAVAIAFTGLTRHRLELHRDGEAIWRDNIARAPRAFAAHNSLGVSLCQRGRFEEGIPILEEAIRLAPNLLDARANLATAWLSTGRIPEAIREFEIILRQRPGHIPTLSNLALACRQSDRLEEAADLNRKILQLRPGDPRAVSNLAHLLGQLKQDAEAATLFPRALEISPGSARLHSGFAQVLYRQGRTDQAIEHSLRAIEFAPESAPPLVQAATEAQSRARESGDSAAADRLEAFLRKLR